MLYLFDVKNSIDIVLLIHFEIIDRFSFVFPQKLNLSSLYDIALCMMMTPLLVRRIWRATGQSPCAHPAKLAG